MWLGMGLGVAYFETGRSRLCVVIGCDTTGLGVSDAIFPVQLPHLPASITTLAGSFPRQPLAPDAHHASTRLQ